VSPVGDQLTLDFSRALITHEQLGRDNIPDYLSISFSSVDAVNHFFGPSSLENEDVVVQLDRTLADLLIFIDKAVGLNHTQEPYWFLFDEGPVKAMHGSPWSYDTHVPIIFMGPGIEAKRIHRRVHPVDVSSTKAAILKITPPGSAQGTPLEEAFQ
jgi:predicted AlkP superfamily pyrophosphatase or phosphodiesterase